MADLKSNLFSFSYLLFIILLPLHLHFPTVSAQKTLFVFGDGSYDVGNKQFVSSNRVDASFPPYGITAGKSTGRWSDGLIVPDYIANFMGIPEIPPILNVAADFSTGASFAIADATVLGSPPETMTLSQQVTKFLENKNKWTDEARSEAIYLINIGSVDYLTFVKNNPNPSDDQKQAFVDQVISAIESSIKVVYGSGGRKFAFQNLAPLGCLPAVKQENGNSQECVKLPSEMAALHNKKLLLLLIELSQRLNGFQNSFYNFFNSIQNRVIKPATYTFETGKAACCGTGNMNGTGCAPNHVCAVPEDYLFFDGIHLTQEANLQVSHLMWGADVDVIGPSNLRELLLLPLDLKVSLDDLMEKIAAMRWKQTQNQSFYYINEMNLETTVYRVDDIASSFVVI